MSGNTEYRLRKEAEATKALMAGLRAIDAADDAEVVADSIEGETQLLEAIDAALAEIDDTEVLVAGLKTKEQQFSERRRAMEERVKRFRALLEQAMAIAEAETLRRPVATLTLRKTPPTVQVDDEGAVPSRFFVEQPTPAPKLDKAALKAALDAKEAVPGASLSNGGVSLTIRRS